ncbi:MAG: hypothetical protein IPK63_19440, partial [Candidatus Competibacteraceae bacterium]|nr:hypothetical protein [Candidatus Competibacteraceae bacterium]
LLNELVGRLPPKPEPNTQLWRDLAAWMLRARRCPLERRLTTVDYQIALELLALDFPESPRRIADHLF